MNMDFKLHMKLIDLVEGEGFSLSSTPGTNGFPNFIIDLTDPQDSDEVSSLGLTINPIFHKKPFRIYPNGSDISFEEIREILLENKTNKSS